MKRSVMFAIWALVSTWSALCLRAQAQPVKRALLIGIDRYTPDPLPAHLPVLPGGHLQDSRFGEGPIAWTNLKGPTFDVQSIELVLQQQYGFTTVTPLTGDQATRQGILDAIERDLIAPSQSGDLDVFYFAGHGSQRLDSNTTDANPDKNHMDETIVPADAFQGAYDIRDKELARLFNEILAKHAKLVAIFDSCHSGTMARGLRTGTARYLAYDDRDVAKDPSAYQGTDLTELPAQNPNFILLTAALSTELANEFHYADTNHDQGVFTRALVAALRNASASWRAVDVLNSVQAYIRADNWDQQPTVEGNLNSSLFGDAPAIHALRAAVTSAHDDTVQLNLGSVAGIAPHTELTSLASGPDRKPVTLEVTTVDSPISSTAHVVSGDKTFQGGEIFQISRLVMASDAQLRIYVPGLNGAGPVQPPPLGRFPDLHWLSDPAAAPFFLVAPGPGGWQEIGPQEAASRGASAFLTLAPPARLVAALRAQPAVQSGSVLLTSDRADAHYYLLGRPTPGATGHTQFALVSPEAFGVPPKGGFVVNEDVACSSGVKATSAPVRGPWVNVESRPQAASSYDAAARQLANLATKLAKYRNWSQLSNINSAVGYWPYHVAIRVHDQDGGHFLEAGEVLTERSAYDIELVADTQTLSTRPDPMFVYVVGFDCSGQSVLLYPDKHTAAGAPVPSLTTGSAASLIPLTSIDGIKKPFGADTIFVLVTKGKITDVSVFDFDGVLSRGAQNPLEQLVSRLGATARGESDNYVPSDWTVQKIIVPNRPQGH